VPTPDDEAVLTIADVGDLLQAWEALHRFIEIENNPGARCECCGQSGVRRPP
jgi:hypothetical protein